LRNSFISICTNSLWQGDTSLPKDGKLPHGSQSFPHGPRIRVFFFQRIFAHYQSGLVKELARHSENEYHFFSDIRDPQGSGIEPLPEKLRRQVPYTVCRTVQLGKYIAFQWRAVREALLGEMDVLILEGSFMHPTNWLALLTARLRRKRVLLYTHGWLRREIGIKRYLKNFFYRLADGLLLYGQRACRIGMEYGFSQGRLYVVYNSLDDEEIQIWRSLVTPDICHNFRTEWFGAEADKPLLVSVGRLNVVKNHALLIQAAARLQHRGQDINILLVGDGPERSALLNLAHKAGVRLVLAGPSYSEEFLSVCISAADMTVIPGAAGLTVIHSLSYGTPVIVNDQDDLQMPESEAVQEGLNGARFRAGDADDLARAIVWVLQNLPRNQRTAAQCRSIVDTAYSSVRMRVVFDLAVAGYRVTTIDS
jgi:glycosyltransferase involved in cell wall biosynthesis